MRLLLSILVLVIMSSCDYSKKEQPHDTKLSFYYWKTSFALDSIERNALTDFNINKLYIRYFDIALHNNLPIPVSPIKIRDSIPNLEIIPVVYIKNEVLLKKDINIRMLANNIVSFINQINNKYEIDISEVQLDCDWSLQSKNSFFELIEDIKKEVKWKISSTIRLHQVKYASKTGIPNVDNGVLMYYNMGSIAGDSLNSIYDRNIARKYIGALKDYPLKLNYALPIYSWLIHIREGKVIRMISRVRYEEVNDKEGFSYKGNNVFIVENDGEYFGQYFKKGDEVKIESITSQQLLEMKNDLLEATGNLPSEIILYDLNSKNLSFYEKEVFKNLINSK